jgi:D-amino-acid oxidase
MPQVVVIGAGVVGLSCAVALREGFDVEVLARAQPTVSEVAGGLWLPYATADDARTLRWAQRTRERLEADGHPLVDYVHLDDAEPWWVAALPPERVRAARDDEVPPGRGPGWVARVPLVEMPRHLAALRERAGGVRVAEVRALEGVAPLVVNCAGLAAGALAGDDAVVPVRGQVVHVRAPAATPCICDERELTYVLPRPDVCVLGGTHQRGDADAAPREDEARDIVARCARLVPALADAEVLGVRAGLRPHREGGARVERVGDLIHCYGHGGAGLTLSWGCAEEVVRLASARTAEAR